MSLQLRGMMQPFQTTNRYQIGPAGSYAPNYAMPACDEGMRPNLRNQVPSNAQVP